MKLSTLVLFIAGTTLSFARAAVAEDVTCKDGASSKGGRGACSGHGGIAQNASKKSASEKPVAVPSGHADTNDSQVVCKDGASSKGGRGACSGHGGVAKATAEPAKTSERAPAPADDSHASPRPAPPRSDEKTEGVDNNATGATARCKDGAYSHAIHHSGACSRHGGVQAWLDD